MHIILFLALIIVLGLTGYAAYLATQLKQAKQTLQQRQQEAAAAAEQTLAEFQQQLIADIHFMTRAVLTEQCEITEGVLRLHYLINALDHPTWEHSALPTLRAHYAATSTMPILDAYKALSKQEQFALDNQRYRLEENHKEALWGELNWLLNHQFPNVILAQKRL